MRKLLLSVIATLFCIFGYSQETDPSQAADILPPSPNASELGKYGLVPVSMATGTPTVDIPVHVYKTANLSVPISLSYSSNGVKVDQIASWVGLNFSLNSGGVITRIIRDEADEDNIVNQQNYQYPDNFYPNNPDALLYLDAASNEGFDTEPDLFSFNFQGHTGKFIFDRNGTPLLMPHQNWIVERILDPMTAGLGYFLITTPDGIQYTFGAVETSKSYDFTECGKNYDGPRESSWYLTEIEHPAGDVITFEYESSNYFYPAGISQTARGVRSAESCVGDSEFPYGTTVKTCFSKILVKSVRLVKIYSSSPTFGSIDFLSTKDRSDLDDYKLNTIVIKDETNEKLKEFSFLYEFSSSTGHSNQYTSEELKHRMFLSSLMEKDRLGKSIKIHSFEYEDINGLPSRLSYSKDHWGFFNGADNSYLIPRDESRRDNFNRVLFQNMGGNREPNATSTKKGILTKVNYPTGGYSQFEYEQNSTFGERIVYPSQTILQVQAEVPEPEDGPLNDVQSVTKLIVMEQTATYSISVGQRPGYEPDPIHARGTIVIKDLTDGGFVKLSKTVSVENSYFSGTVDLLEDHEYSFTVTATGEGVSALFTLLYSPTKPYTVEDNIATGGLRISKIINYDPIVDKNEEVNYYYGRYNSLTHSTGKTGSPPQYYSENLTKITCSVQCSMAEVVYGVLSSNSINTLFMPGNNNIYYEYVTVSRGSEHSQGVEEHQFIINFDYAGQPVWGNNLIKDAPLTNFGWNNGLEKFARIYKKVSNGFDLVQQTFYDYIEDTRNYREVNALVIRKNYDPSCYSEVVVDCDESNINKQYKVYRCVTNHTHHWVIGGRTFFGIGDNRTICNATGNNMQEEIYGNHPCFLKDEDETATRPTELDYIDAIEYKNIAYWFYLKRKVETFFNNNSDFSTVTEFVYDNPIHAQVSKQRVVGSDGKLNETLIKYPDDYEDVGNVLSLKEKNIVSVPIKKENIINGMQIGGNVILYNDVGQPKEVYNYETTDIKSPVAHSNTQLVPSSDYQLKLEYVYDPLSNRISELAPTNSTKKSYLWGYDNSLPIAEVLNASSNEILFKGFEDENGTLEDENNLARTGHKYWNSGSYDFSINSNFTPGGGSALQMSYWYWENGQWVFSEILDFNNTINQGTRLDDIRVFPKSSQMVTYTYDPLIGVTSITDTNNITTYFEYDDLGRLKQVKDSDQNIVKHYKYHYQGEQ